MEAKNKNAKSPDDDDEDDALALLLLTLKTSSTSEHLDTSFRLSTSTGLPRQARPRVPLQFSVSWTRFLNRRIKEKERERENERRSTERKGITFFFFPSHFQTKKKTRNEKKKFLLSHFFLSLFYSVNVQLGPREERLLITGLHTVADISCAGEDDVLFFWLLCSIFSSSGAFSTLSQTLFPSC